MTPSQRWGLLALVAISFLTTCTPKLYPMPEQPITSAGLVLSRIADHGADIRAISATARAEQWGKGGVRKGRVTIMASVDGKVRLDAWSPTYDLLASMTANNHEFKLFQRGTDECLSGPPCRRNLERLLPVGLELIPTANALLGRPPIRPDSGEWTLVFDRSVGMYRLWAPLSDGSIQEVWATGDGQCSRVRVSRGRETIYAISFSDFEGTGRLRHPTELKFEHREGEVLIQYRDVELNGDLSDSDWIIECPQGMITRTLDCEAE